MELSPFANQEHQFSSPQEELEYLREKIALKERELQLSRGESSVAVKKEAAPVGKTEQFSHTERETAVAQGIAEHVELPRDEALAKGYKMLEPEINEIVLALTPEEHDDKMSELLGILNEKGILNTLEVVGRLNNPHIEDDFHRFLVEYIKKGFPIKDLREKTPLARALHHTLYEVSLPEGDKDEKEKHLKEVISSMEQFYAGMLSVSQGASANENYFSIELAISNGSEEFVFYVSVPDAKSNLFEKQILSIFPDAKIEEKKDDYNIFNTEGVSVASNGIQKKNSIFPIKTYEEFDYDPLNVLLNTFSKINRDGEGAAIQIIFNPAGDYYVKKYKHALEEIRKGMSVKKAIDIQHSAWGEIYKGIRESGTEIVKGTFSGSKDKKMEEKKAPDETAIENITNKIKSPILNTNIRLVVSAGTKHRAEEIISDIESSFNQFDNTLSNSLGFERVKEKNLHETLHDFSFRMYSEKHRMPLNTHELTTFMHFPGATIGASGQLRQSKAATAPAPLDTPQKGLFIGTNKHRNIETKIFMTDEDRLRHFYVIGQTGTGKSIFLRNLIIQDIQNGEGCCFIDPHGSDVQSILACVPPERYEDVIYFDPSHTERPMAFNMLEYDTRYPDQKIFVVNELFSIFDKLFDMKATGGPMFEQYFRNSAMLVLEDPESGNTLVDVSRVLANKAYRELKLSRCKNPIVLQFWREVADKAGGESALANIVPYITSKFDVFLANDIMRPIIAQEKSSFDFRDIMDKKKILLVNLSKGRLGDINSSLLGLILVGKMLIAALGRVDAITTGFPPFYLYIDEFQNITTNSISVILSEARKYKLSLHIAHQFIGQLQEDIRDAVFGNVGSMVSFRVGADDSEYLEKQFAPVFGARDLMNLDNFNGYTRMLINGKPTRPFNFVEPFPPKGEASRVEALKELSYLKYGRDRAEVEALVAEKFKKPSMPSPFPERTPLA